MGRTHSPGAQGWLWDVHTMARRLREVAGDDRRHLPDHDALVRSIRRWESGKISVLSERYRLLYCRALEMNEEDLFADGHDTAHERFPLESHDDLSAMSSFRGADRRVGGGHLYASVLGYLERDVAPRLFGGFDGSTAFVTAAAFTEMAGWMALDAGQDTTASRHFSRALDLVSVGGDRQLEAHILGSMSHLAHQQGQAREALRLAHRGTAMLAETRTSAPTMEARLLSMVARGFALQGESGECTRSLCEAEQALERETEDDVSPWIGPFDEGTLALDAARSKLALGHVDQAETSACRALALRSGDRTRSRALGRLVLARALLAQGRLEEVCRIGAALIEDTRSLSSVVVTRELADLRDRLNTYRGDETVADFAALVDVALYERRWMLQWGGPRG
jgi:hypothetical protein